VAEQVSSSPADAGLESVINSCRPETVAVNEICTGNASHCSRAEDKTPTSGSKGRADNDPPWGIRQGVMAKFVLIPSPSIGNWKPTGISISLDGVDVLALPLFAAKAQVPRENNSSATRVRVRMCSLLPNFSAAENSTRSDSTQLESIALTRKYKHPQISILCGLAALGQRTLLASS